MCFELPDDDKRIPKRDIADAAIAIRVPTVQKDAIGEILSLRQARYECRASCRINLSSMMGLISI